MISPPFLVSFSDKHSFLSALHPNVLYGYKDDIERLIAAQLPPIVSYHVLACLFGYSVQFVKSMAAFPSRYYRTFFIRKGRSSKHREIHAPRVALKVIQKWFATHLCNAMMHDEHVFGFIPGRSAPQAAATHCGADWIYSIDIEDFFPATTSQKVLEALLRIRYPFEGANIITSLCCLNNGLAQGSPASPILSNLVFQECDCQLKELAGRFGVIYTRYADDIVFSGKLCMPVELPVLSRIIIQQAGWNLAENKTHYAQRPNRLKVHGLLVHGTTPRLTKGYRNRIRAFRHLVEVGKVSELDEPRIKGHISYANSIKNAGHKDSD